MHILDTIWKETLWRLWKCEINVGEYNTLDLVKDNTIKKKRVFVVVVSSSLKCKRKAIMYYSSPGAISILATRWQQCMCKVLDWSNEPLHYCSKCCIKTQMFLIPLLINVQVHKCALSSNNSMVLFHCNSYCKLESAVRLTRI